MLLEGKFMLQVLGWALLIEWLESKKSLPELVRFMEVPVHFAPYPETVIRRKIAAGRKVLGWIYGQDYCMPQALIFFRFCRKWGLPVHIYFGIHKQKSGSLKGHAWLVLRHQAFIEPQDPSLFYQVVFRYPEISDREKTLKTFRCCEAA